MARLVSPQEFHNDTSAPIVLDARAPSEYRKGHIPGAISFPLFTDDERAQVGTAYKQKGPDQAMLLGLDLVGPKLADFIRKAKQLNPKKLPFRMYCFRGGERSKSLAWLLEKGGFEVTLLQGGYKAYRHEIRRAFQEPQKIMILSGCTGAGKTRLLLAMAERGEQIVDLEALASHRGSAFGGYHQPPELNTEMFHNLIHGVWSKLDRGRTAWIEDEGRTLGRLLVPEEVWGQMRVAPVIFLDIPQEERVKLLVEEYADYDDTLLRSSIDRIAKRLGGLDHRLCLEALEEGRYAEVAQRTLDYYDQAYRHCLTKREPEPYWELPLPGIETEPNVQALLQFFQEKVQGHEATAKAS
jgi:tRNA 2-selenouridine synthase